MDRLAALADPASGAGAETTDCGRGPGRRAPEEDQTEKDDPQPQVLFTPGLLNLNPEPCRPST